MGLQIIWKVIVGYEKLYEVSNTGIVRSLGHWRISSTNHNLYTYRKGRILKQKRTTAKYRSVNLCKRDSKFSTRLVHRLVAEAFIPNPENKPQVNHINGIKSDNRMENLEWVSPRENISHAVKMGLSKQKGEDNSQAKLKEYQVLDIRSRYIKGQEKLKIIAKEYSIDKYTVWAIGTNKLWSHI